MPSGRLREIIRSGTSDPLVVYAGLFAECEARAQQLTTLLQEASWMDAMARDVWYANQRLGRPGTTDAFAAMRTLTRDANLWDESAGLVRVAGVLSALDRWYHRVRQGRVRYGITTLPGAPEVRYLFLPRSQNRVGDWVPDALCLQRDASDFGPNVASLLKLSWQVVRFNDAGSHGIRPRVDELARSVERVLVRRLEEHGTLRIALAAPFCAREFPIEEFRDGPWRDGRVRCRFHPLSESELALAHDEVHALLDACSGGRVDILCLPELNVCPGLLERLRQGLARSTRDNRPGLVVAGSYHVSVAERVFNRCQVYDGRGQALWHQDKFTPYGTTPSGETPAFIEHIARAGVLQLIDACFARLSTPICLDYLSFETLARFFRASGVNLFLVPAMSPRLDAFERQAGHFGTTNRASTFVANSGWIPGASGPPPEGVAYMPVKAERGLVTHRSERVGPLRIYDLAGIIGTIEEEVARM